MKPTGKKPYFTAKALAGILSGDNQCQAALWVKSRYWYSKRPSTFDFVAWQDQHNLLVSKRKAELERDGWRVYTEAQNRFELRGNNANVAGKPDLVGFRGDEVLISDGKTGGQRASDFWQVLCYMALLPLDRPTVFEGKTVSGEIVYTAGSIEIAPVELTQERRNALFAKIRELSRESPFEFTPSPQECNFCDIADCSARVEAPVPTAVTEF